MEEKNNSGDKTGMILYLKNALKHLSFITYFKKLPLTLLLTLLFLEAGLRIEGFISSSLQEHRNMISLRQKGAYCILCLGESSTMSGGGYSYPSQLEKILNRNASGIKFRVINKGITGIDTNEILFLLESNLDRYKPDMVITMMGMNDSGDRITYESSWVSAVARYFRCLRIYKLAKTLWHWPEGVKKQPAGEEGKEKLKFISYLNEGRYGDLEQHIKKLIENSPGSAQPYGGLAWLYLIQQRYAESEEVWKKAIELDPQNVETYGGAAWLYILKGDYSAAERSFEKIIELRPTEAAEIYPELAWLYFNGGRYAESEQVLKKGEKFFPDDDRVYGGLATLNYAMGKKAISMAYAQKTRDVILKFGRQETIANYRKLKDILDKRNIRLVCMQYPRLPITPLKRIFYGEKVLFVDNEKIFEETVNREGYNSCFWDMAGGSFGHCTPKGNQLIAENIAKEILKEVFDGKIKLLTEEAAR